MRGDGGEDEGDLPVIYALIDPRDSRVRYVGKTIQPLRIRLQSHMSEATVFLGTNPAPRVGWLQELAASGLKPRIRCLEMVAPGDDWRTVERRWIMHYRTSEPAGLVNGNVLPFRLRLQRDGRSGRHFLTATIPGSRSRGVAWPERADDRQAALSRLASRLAQDGVPAALEHLRAALERRPDCKEEQS